MGGGQQTRDKAYKGEHGRGTADKLHLAGVLREREVSGAVQQRQRVVVERTLAFPEREVSQGGGAIFTRRKRR